MTVIQIEAVTDLLCPWCYVGKRNLDSAIDQFRAVDPSTEFEVAWKPFYLGPAMKNTGYDKRALYTGRFFQTGDFDSAISLVSAGCLRSGIRLDISGTTGNSRQSHKLLALALRRGGPPAQDRLLETLFRGHFELGADISDRRFLLDAAVDAGLDEADAAYALDSEKAGEGVDAEVLRAKKAGVTGVPSFTVQGRWRIGGSQEPDVFLRVFERVVDDE
ncbi:hypothetical protein C8035_v000620 [Colletotrichum spinosum]|uniref:DSBA-like thioredoxin domain-containing protein n=1 Tax=Colletotrichum spinosum TaxID=1347390 RepID=A0A4V3HS67_9PEZI|nr:hypothetical protein C8035_v000620 [Colletotrichum spinosum]